MSSSFSPISHKLNRLPVNAPHREPAPPRVSAVELVKEDTVDAQGLSKLLPRYPILPVIESLTTESRWAFIRPYRSATRSSALVNVQPARSIAKRIIAVILWWQCLFSNLKGRPGPHRKTGGSPGRPPL
jgi:hypothetical protein